MVYSTEISNNVGESCWQQCNKKGGPCTWCGEGASDSKEGMCCKKGNKDRGCDGTIGGDDHHRCDLRDKRMYIFSIKHLLPLM